MKQIIVEFHQGDKILFELARPVEQHEYVNMRTTLGQLLTNKNYEMMLVPHGLIENIIVLKMNRETEEKTENSIAVQIPEKSSSIEVQTPTRMLRIKEEKEDE